MKVLELFPANVLHGQNNITDIAAHGEFNRFFIGRGHFLFLVENRLRDGGFQRIRSVVNTEIAIGKPNAKRLRGQVLVRRAKLRRRGS